MSHGGDQPSEAEGSVDNIGMRNLTAARPLDGVWFARTGEELDGADRICEAIYGTELGWLSRGEELLTRDKYHPHARYLLAWAGGIPVGLMRIVADSSVGLPVESFIDVSDFKCPHGSIECQRLMVLSQYRSFRCRHFPFGVFGALLKAAIQYCCSSDVRQILADLFLATKTTPLKRLCKLGFVETGLTFHDNELGVEGLSTVLVATPSILRDTIARSEGRFPRYLEPHDPRATVTLGRKRIDGARLSPATNHPKRTRHGKSHDGTF